MPGTPASASELETQTWRPKLLEALSAADLGRWGPDRTSRV